MVWEDEQNLELFRVKNYILDTNVLLHDPNSPFNFKDNHVLIPIEVIEEIDRFKRESTERGQNARSVSRMLDGLRDLRNVEVDYGASCRDGRAPATRLAGSPLLSLHRTSSHTTGERLTG